MLEGEALLNKAKTHVAADFPAEAEDFPPRPKIFRQTKAANYLARTANQSPVESGLDKKYKVECDWISIFSEYAYTESVSN
ncbi:hypothetical protein V6N13_053503 [Hibiscus sabdariffa]